MRKSPDPVTRATEDFGSGCASLAAPALLVAVIVAGTFGVVGQFGRIVPAVRASIPAALADALVIMAVLAFALYRWVAPRAGYQRRARPRTRHDEGAGEQSFNVEIADRGSVTLRLDEHGVTIVDSVMSPVGIVVAIVLTILLKSLLVGVLIAMSSRRDRLRRFPWDTFLEAEDDGRSLRLVRRDRRRGSVHIHTKSWLRGRLQRAVSAQLPLVAPKGESAPRVAVVRSEPRPVLPGLGWLPPGRRTPLVAAALGVGALAVLIGATAQLGLAPRLLSLQAARLLWAGMALAFVAARLQSDHSGSPEDDGFTVRVRHPKESLARRYGAVWTPANLRVRPDGVCLTSAVVNWFDVLLLLGLGSLGGIVALGWPTIFGFLWGTLPFVVLGLPSGRSVDTVLPRDEILRAEQRADGRALTFMHPDHTLEIRSERKQTERISARLIAALGISPLVVAESSVAAQASAADLQARLERVQRVNERQVAERDARNR